jgi:hypothetical protein
MSFPVRMRIGTAAEWQAANPILRHSDVAFSSDTGQYKIGDGVSKWSALPCAGGFGGGDWDSAE